MEFSRRITNTLHDEHMATMALLNNLEALLLEHDPKNPPKPDDAKAARLFADVTAAVESEIGTHFAFEEEQLFPRLAELGDDDICVLLKEEHDTILPVGKELSEMSRAARTEAFSTETWGTFRQLGLELLERMVSHIQKEEMGLLPALEDALDEEADMGLANEYAMGR